MASPLFWGKGVIAKRLSPILFKKFTVIYFRLYSQYLDEIATRKKELGLNPKPIDSAELLSEIIDQITDTANEHREESKYRNKIAQASSEKSKLFLLTI